MNYFLESIDRRTKRVMNLLVMFICLVSLSANAQGTINGQVTDESGEGLPGVTVQIQGTTTGAITDIDGNFSLRAASDAVLDISFVGFESQSIPLNGRTSLNVTLEVNITELNEVVVVGYGSVRKSDITGSVSSVSSEELQAFPVLNAGQALQGRAAGVAVQTNNGGEPGADISIRVRGSSSLGASSDPLIVVDGFVGASFPQQNDIESMEILKDASATAIYGSRGSGGVILITTKKGKTGQPRVELNSAYAIQETNNRLDLLDANGFADYRNMIATNQGDAPYEQGSGNTDWQDEIYQMGSTQNHQFSIAGGGSNVNYYVSGTYFKQDGIVINSDFEKVQFLSNVDVQATDKLKIGMNAITSRSTQNGVPTQSTGRDQIASVNGGGDDVVALAFRFAPDVERFNDDGNFSQNTVGDDIENPWAVASQIRNETKTDNTRINLYLDYEIIEGLNFKTTLGYRTQNSSEGYFKPSTFVLSPTGAAIESIKRTNVLNENYLTYKKRVGNGDLTLLAGHSYQKRTTERFRASTQNLLSDDFLWYNLAAGHINTRQVSSSFSESEIESFFGRVNYNWDEKYLFTATVRRDGASNFAANNKYATFPSFAIGWRIANEDFLKDNNVISDMKLRASYGVTGNQAISPYESLAALGIVQASEDDTDPGVNTAREDNPNLKWETSFQTNIGFDVSFLDNRINLSADYYNIDTEDLLAVDRSVLFYTGVTDLEVLTNVGAINNKGFEITLGTTNIDKDGFRWTTDLNWSTNKSLVVELIGTEIRASGAPGYFISPNTYLLREGEEIGVLWGLEYRGVYKGGDVPEGVALKGSSYDDGNPILGEPMFTEVADDDGAFDGVIDTNDEQIIGNPNPDFTYGISNNFAYKNFDLNIFFQGSHGGDIMNLTAVQLYNGDSNGLTDVLNSWSLENPNSDIPRAISSRGREISTRFVEDGSFLRLKNIALGYTIPGELTQKWGISSVRLSLSAQNLLTFTKYSGLDPEVNYFGSGGESTGDANVILGHDYGNYPNVRSYTFGINMRF